MCILNSVISNIPYGKCNEKYKKYQYFCRETLKYNIKLMELVKLQYYKEISINEYYTWISTNHVVNLYEMISEF